MRVIRWNMQHKKASWHFLYERHGDADLALLQEACTPPPNVSAGLDVGPGPWIHKGWNGARAVVRMSDRVSIERLSVADIIAAASPNSTIDTPARLAAAITTLAGGESIGLVSVETGAEWSKRVPEMIRQIRQCCGNELPWIVGGDLTTWWNSEATVFGDMMRIGLPLVGPHTATYYSPLHRQTPSGATLQLDYVFASRAIAHRLTVRALNDPNDWGPSDHCRIVVDLEEARFARTRRNSVPC